LDVTEAPNSYYYMRIKMRRIAVETLRHGHNRSHNATISLVLVDFHGRILEVQSGKVSNVEKPSAICTEPRL
jgi:hypothetical protein